jgi:hypothetical protein
MMHSPRQALLGCAVVLLGIPVYALIQRGQAARVSTAGAEAEIAMDEQ